MIIIRDNDVGSSACISAGDGTVHRPVFSSKVQGCLRTKMEGGDVHCVILSKISEK